MNDNVTRRMVLQRGLQLCAGVAAAALAGCGARSGGDATGVARPACADPARLSLNESNAREAYGYVEASSDPQRVCSGCAFYRAADDGGACGVCDIFNGGPANPGGFCTSWTAVEAPAAPPQAG